MTGSNQLWDVGIIPKCVLLSNCRLSIRACFCVCVIPTAFFAGLRIGDLIGDCIVTDCWEDEGSCLLVLDSDLSIFERFEGIILSEIW